MEKNAHMDTQGARISHYARLSQQKIYELLKVEGDCWHIQGEARGDSIHIPISIVCAKCDVILAVEGQDSNLYKSNPDLTTPEGAFWLLARLPKWDKFEEFCEWLKDESLHFQYDYAQDQETLIKDILTWLGSDPSALYKAICEFTEVEG